MLCEFASKFIRSNSIWNHTGLNTVVVNPFELRCQNQPINLQICNIILVWLVGFGSVFSWWGCGDIPSACVGGEVSEEVVINWPSGSISLLWKLSCERNIWKARDCGLRMSVTATWGSGTRRRQVCQISRFPYI